MGDESTSSGAGLSLPGHVPAPPSRAALLWQAVSAAHDLLERKHRYYEATETDLRLGEQLTLLPALHDWIPVTDEEVDVLRAELRAYVTRSSPSASRSAAEHVGDVVREMARIRGRLAGRYPEILSGSEQAS